MSWVSAFLSCASSTICSILAKVVSSPTYRPLLLNNRFYNGSEKTHLSVFGKNWILLLSPLIYICGASIPFRPRISFLPALLLPYPPLITTSGNLRFYTVPNTLAVSEPNQTGPLLRILSFQLFWIQIFAKHEQEGYCRRFPIFPYKHGTNYGYRYQCIYAQYRI